MDFFAIEQSHSQTLIIFYSTSQRTLYVLSRLFTLINTFIMSISCVYFQTSVRERERERGGGRDRERNRKGFLYGYGMLKIQRLFQLVSISCVYQASFVPIRLLLYTFIDGALKCQPIHV